MCTIFLADSMSELCVLADFTGTLNTTATKDMLYNDALQIFAFFFNSIYKVKLVPHF